MTLGFMPRWHKQTSSSNKVTNCQERNGVLLSHEWTKAVALTNLEWGTQLMANANY